MTNGNDAAHPVTSKNGAHGVVGGLTKRELFAAMAMQGMLASCPEGIRFNPKQQKLPWKAWGESCITMADALIDALNKKD